jgi:endonuclease III
MDNGVITVRTRTVWEGKPPANWSARWSLCTTKDLPTVKSLEQLYDFVKSNCKEDVHRMGWDDGLKAMQKGSEARFCASVLLAKASNGMMDKSVVPHINALTWGVDLSLDILANTEYCARLLRRTSKWLKNGVVVSDLARYLIEAGREISRDFKFYVGLREFGHKTTALLIWGWLEETTMVPVDSHVRNFTRCFGWTNGLSEDEIAFQLVQWVPVGFLVSFNDMLGTLGQYLMTSKRGANNRLRATHHGRLRSLLNIAPAEIKKLLERLR